MSVINRVKKHKSFGLVRKRQQGAAMAEFVVVGIFLLVPLMMLVPMMGKYIDTKHKVEEAARYGAWERTVWFESTPSSGGISKVAVKGEAEILNEIGARILAKAGDSVNAAQRTGNQPPTLDPMQYYQNRTNGQNESLLVANDAGVYGVYSDNETGAPGAIASAMNGVLNAVSFGGFSLNIEGLYTSRFELNVYEPSGIEAFTGVDIKFKAEHTLYTDGWGAGGKEHNAAMVQGLMPTTLLSGGFFSGILSAVGSLPIAKEIHPDKLIFGNVDVDALPAQRLADE